ncbi:MAG TPA: NHL repeat-containing protein [Pirellulales bacterium]|nr:NHL repeat-containing protein [Pirellulales bacterium]
MSALLTATKVTFAVVTVLGSLAGRPADAQELEYPLAIATHGSAIYLVDRNLPGIWKSEGGKLGVFFQGSKSFRTPLNAPRCLAIDSEGRLYVGDSATREVYRFDPDGQPQPLTGASIGIPMGIAIDAQGDLLVSDLELPRIWKIALSNGKKTKVERYADVPEPAGICLDGEGRLWVVSRGTNALLRVDSKGNVETVISGRAFEFPHSVAVDKEGTAFVCDGYARAVWKIPSGGKPQPQKWVAGDPLVQPVALAWQDENLLVVDPRAKSVFRIDREGQISTVDLGTK